MTPMSKKHFEALAANLARAKPSPQWHNYAPLVRQWHRDIASVAGVCKRFNSDFDQDRFYLACGAPELVSGHTEPEDEG